jgi:hypothetical protein
MSNEQLYSLQAALDEWEAQYHEARQELHLHELYLLWIRLFRLSRQMIHDHNILMRRGTLTDAVIAYTGETKRLAELRSDKA